MLTSTSETFKDLFGNFPQSSKVVWIGIRPQTRQPMEALIRRNIVVEGINLNALKNKQFNIGEAILKMTGFCFPCSRMEENLGKGGFNAMRRHGGITYRVIQEGKIGMGNEKVLT
jgi:MOSC domain-containing protein YiiM